MTLLMSCSLLPPKTEQTVSAGDNSSVKQESVQATNASAGQADLIESITTENTDGIPVHWFVIGALVFGMIIPQPRLIRWLF